MGALVAAAALLGGALAGCSGSSSPAPSRTSVPDRNQFSAPSSYMGVAVAHYNAERSRGAHPPYFAPVSEEHRSWTGDPAYYEKLCGAKITGADGAVVSVTDSGAYQDLMKNSRQWATFNAWLQDPAVYAYVGNVDSDDLTEFAQGRAVGSTKACPAFHAVPAPATSSPS